MKEIIRDFANRLMFRHRFELFRPSRFPRGRSLEIDLARLFERQHRQLEVILDVGANVGQTARRFSLRFPNASIHSFEPIAEAFDSLRKNVRSLGNVTPHNFALGDATGHVRMEIDPGDSERNRIVEESASRARFEECSIKTLDDVCAELSLSRIDFLKIDVEGYESHVLNGATRLFKRGQIASVYAEVDFLRKGLHANFFEIHEFFERNDFIFYALYDYSAWWNPASEAFSNGLWIHPTLWPPNLQAEYV